jgi:anti-sigma factor RsiW
LSEFADGTLDQGTARPISSHLESCSRCRREVATIREMDLALREVPIPALPDDLFDRVIERREAGVRTLLPDAPIAPPRRRSWRSVAAVAGVVLFASLAGIALTNGEAVAGASHLRLGPPTASSVVPLTYTPGTVLAGESMVRVRARVWPAEDPTASYTVDLGLLQRSDDAFAGAVTLPLEAGFALISMESLDGTVLDANGGDFWEYESPLVEPVEVARARLEALRGMGQDGVILGTPIQAEAIRAAERHPDDVALWNARAQYELWAATDPTEVLSSHGERLEGFAARALAGDRSSDELGELAGYAATLEAYDVLEQIVSALATVQPAHPQVLRSRLLDAVQSRDVDALARVEDVFNAGPDPEGLAASVGYRLALAGGNAGLILRWADRLAAGGPAVADELAAELATLAMVRREGIDRLHTRLAFYDGSSEALRPLHQPRGAWKREVRRRRAVLRAALGEALLLEGETEAGLEALEASIAERWDPRVAATLVRASDRPLTANLERLARLIEVDPTIESEADVRIELSADEVNEARRELAGSILAEARGGDVPDAVLRSRVGAEVPLDHGGVTLIALWQAPPVVDDAETEAFVRHTRALDLAGVRTLVAGPERWLDEIVEIAGLAGARAVVDHDATVSDAFGGWHLWEYVIVHDGWYSVHHDLEEAARLALLNSEIR